MENNQKQDWWPDMDAKSTSEVPDSPTSKNASVTPEYTNITPTTESSINISDDIFEDDTVNHTCELSEEEPSRESEDPNPYIQYPWNQIPRQQSSTQDSNQNPYGYSQSTYQNNTYQQNPYQNNPYHRQNIQGSPASPFATATMIMGIVSLLVTCCGGSFIFGALGIMFALLSRQGTKLEPQAKTGLILSIIGFAAGIIIVIGSFAMLLSPENQEIFQEYERFYYEFDEETNEYNNFDSFGDFEFDFDDSIDIFEDSL